MTIVCVWYSMVLIVFLPIQIRKDSLLSLSLSLSPLPHSLTPLHHHLYTYTQVASVFTLPISKLANPSIQRYTRFKIMSALRFPVFLGGPRRVWGVTAFILDMTLTQLLPKHFNYVPIAARRNYS